MSIDASISLPTTGLYPSPNAASENSRLEVNPQKPNARTDSPSSSDASNNDKPIRQEKAGNDQQTTQAYSDKELQAIKELKQRDQEVRVHEAAHLAGAGQYASGGASYSYKTGPDGIRYAVGGEVSVDTSPVPGDPEATLEKSRKIRAAALAPAEPSATDQAIAAQAAKMANDARMEISQEQLQAREKATAGDTQADQTRDTVEKSVDDKSQASEQYIQTARNDKQDASPLIDLTA